MNETDPTPLRLQPGQTATARVQHDVADGPAIEFRAVTGQTRHGLDVTTTGTISVATARELRAALDRALYEATGLPPITDEVRDFVRSGQKIKAIKAYRLQPDERSPEEIAAVGPRPLVSLRAAKCVVDELEIQMHKAGELTYVPQHLSR